MAIFAGVILLCNSCTKVSEDFIIGTWKFVSFQVNLFDGDGWHEILDDETITITFKDNGTFFMSSTAGESEDGTWGYIGSTNQLRFQEMLWDVYRHNNKEMELSMNNNDYAETIFLKKIH